MFVYYFYIVIIMSILTIIIYGIDKIRAINNMWRIKETTLLIISLLFGSIGGLFSMYIIRHKNHKVKFVILNWVFLIIHIALGLFLYTISF